MNTEMKIEKMVDELVAAGVSVEKATQMACRLIKKDAPSGKKSIGGAPAPPKKAAKPSDGAGVPAKKKQLCFWFNNPKGCNKGDDCEFSHVKVSDLPEGTRVPTCPMGFKCFNKLKCVFRHNLKVRLCDKFETPEGCPYGAKCTFAHGEDELRADSERED